MKFICKALLFDFDGTLIDSNVSSEIGWKKWAQENQVSFEHIQSVHHGRRPLETISIVAPQLDATKEAEIFLDHQAALFDGIVPIDGALEFFNKLPVQSIAIVTSTIKELCLSRLRHVGLRTDMKMVTAESVKVGKPDPEGFMLGAELLSVKPEDCVAFEDSIAGIAAAKKAGMKVIAIQSTHKADELMEADLIIQSYEELRVEMTFTGAISILYHQ
jgi:mannitol-1-/sugar-/sorbitol-6-phosphatase